MGKKYQEKQQERWSFRNRKSKEFLRIANDECETVPLLSLAEDLSEINLRKTRCSTMESTDSPDGRFCTISGAVGM